MTYLEKLLNIKRVSLEMSVSKGMDISYCVRIVAPTLISNISKEEIKLIIYSIRRDV